MFLHEAKQILRKYLLLHSCSPNFSDNSAQVLISMHSSVQLLYLLLFFAIGVGVVILTAKGT